jgi:molybdenum cofactor synthesis domain-containing protein
MQMRAAILTVSTSVAAGVNVDASGVALADAARNVGAEVVVQDVVPDNQAAIEGWLREQVAAGIELVFTTGGTGFTPDDVTPEATRAVIEREAPGFVEAMRSESRQFTKMAMLSRAVSGIAGGSFIINFPGNPKAITELFPVVGPVLPHAVGTLHRQDGKRPEHPGR